MTVDLITLATGRVEVVVYVEEGDTTGLAIRRGSRSCISGWKYSCLAGGRLLLMVRGGGDIIPRSTVVPLRKGKRDKAYALGA